MCSWHLAPGTLLDRASAVRQRHGDKVDAAATVAAGGGALLGRRWPRRAPAGRTPGEWGDCLREACWGKPSGKEQQTGLLAVQVKTRALLLLATAPCAWYAVSECLARSYQDREDGGLLPAPEHLPTAFLMHGAVLLPAAGDPPWRNPRGGSSRDHRLCQGAGRVTQG